MLLHLCSQCSEKQVDMAMEPYHRETAVVPTRAKSPGRVFKGSRPARQDYSRAKSRAIEASLDPDEPWVPAAETHAKTPEEEVCMSCGYIEPTLSNTFAALRDKWTPVPCVHNLISCGCLCNQMCALIYWDCVM